MGMCTDLWQHLADRRADHRVHLIVELPVGKHAYLVEEGIVPWSAYELYVSRLGLS